MGEWQKEYFIKLDGLKNVVLMEVLIDYESNRLEILDSVRIFKEEYREYKDDNDNWIPIKRHLREWATELKWSGIKYIRALVRIKQALGMNEEDLAWIYQGRS